MTKRQHVLKSLSDVESQTHRYIRDRSLITEREGGTAKWHKGEGGGQGAPLQSGGWSYG